MPMVGHETICRNADAGSFVGFLENFFKGSIVRRLLKQRQPTDTPVQHVVGKSAGGNARAARHDMVSIA